MNSYFDHNERKTYRTPRSQGIQVEEAHLTEEQQKAITASHMLRGTDLEHLALEDDRRR